MEIRCDNPFITFADYSYGLYIDAGNATNDEVKCRHHDDPPEFINGLAKYYRAIGMGDLFTEGERKCCHLP